VRVPPVSASINVTLAGRPTFKAIVMQAHQASGTIEIWAPPATRMLLYRAGEGWRDGDRRAARVEVVELRPPA
jgi:hypothetical protein